MSASWFPSPVFPPSISREAAYTLRGSGVLHRHCSGPPGGREAGSQPLGSVWLGPSWEACVLDAGCVCRPPSPALALVPRGRLSCSELAQELTA